MSKHPMTIEDLWAMPRVGTPVPSPDGQAMIVPVTTYSMEANKGTTRLYWVPTHVRGRARGAADAPRALTSAEVSSNQPAWSPDGERLVFVRKPGGEASERGPKYPNEGQLYLMSVGGGEPERLTDLPRGLTDPRWFPDGRRVAFLSEVFRGARTLERTARRVKELAENPVKAAVTENRVYRFWDHWLTEDRVHHLFVLDLDTRELLDLTPDSERWFDPMDPVEQFSISPDGREIAFSACRSEPPYDPLAWGVFTVKVPARITADATVARTVSLTPKGVSDASRPVYSPDGRWIVFGVQRDHEFYADRVRIVAYDRSSRAQQVLTEDWKFSASGWVFASDSRTLIFHSELRGKTAFYSIDVPAAARSARARTPKLLLRAGGMSSPRVAGGRVFASRASLLSPPEVMSCDLRGRSVRWHTAFTAPVLKGIELGSVSEEAFIGADGHKVQMYVVQPPASAVAARGRAGTRAGTRSSAAPKLPLVHMVHGGPHGAFNDEWHWRWCSHLFAAPGYMVALVNFHGSTGWGQKFAQCIQGQWGRQPFEDIMAATDYLLEKKWVDKARMAVAGASYGGYLVSWIGTQTDRFACIVNHAGVSDFHGQLGSDVTQDDERSMGGVLWRKLDGMDRWNPARHASGYRTPMLITHGEKDYRVPYGQGIELYNVYKAMGLPARLVCYPDENHWVLKPRNSVHWYGEVMTWLDRWIGKRKPAARSAARPAARPAARRANAPRSKSHPRQRERIANA